MKKVNKPILKIIVLILCICLYPRNCKACTVFFYSDGNKVYAGTNKDWNNLNTTIRTIPGKPGQYGIVYFGYTIPEGFQNVGGINDKGLWYDGASLPKRNDIANYYNKPEFEGELCEKALRECSCLEEVLELYSYYYTPHWQGHIMWGDASGQSVVIEFGEKDIVIIPMTGNYMLMTNFYLCDTINTRWYNCKRFNAAQALLESYTTISAAKCRDVLKVSSSKDGWTPTLYSVVYNLTEGELYLYNYHRFTEFVKLNINELLEQGDQQILMPQLFRQLEVVSPLNCNVPGTNTCSISWKGAESVYSIMFSENSNFESCIEKFEYGNTGIVHMIAINWIIAFMIIASLRETAIPGLQKICSTAIMVITLSACSLLLDDPYPESTSSHNITLHNLKPSTTYYYRIISYGDKGINSQSPVYNFTTSGK